MNARTVRYVAVVSVCAATVAVFVVQNRRAATAEAARHSANQAAMNDQRVWSAERRGYDLAIEFARISLRSAEETHRIQPSERNRIELAKARAVVALAEIDLAEAEAKRGIKDPERLRQIEREHDRKRELVRLKAS